MKRDPWTLVLDESELAPGMCVELRPCNRCGKKERNFLTRQQGASPLAHDAVTNAFVTSVSRYAWEMLGRCGSSFKFSQLGKAIRERRLYRLIDDDAAADETTTTRRKERAHVPR